MGRIVDRSRRVHIKVFLENTYARRLLLLALLAQKVSLSLLRGDYDESSYSRHFWTIYVSGKFWMQSADFVDQGPQFWNFCSCGTALCLDKNIDDYYNMVSGPTCGSWHDSTRTGSPLKVRLVVPPEVCDQIIGLGNDVILHALDTDFQEFLSVVARHV